MENLELKRFNNQNTWDVLSTNISDDGVNFKADQQKSSNLNNKEI